MPQKHLLDPNCTTDQPEQSIKPETVDVTGAYQSAPGTEPTVTALPVNAPTIPGYVITGEIAKGGMGRVLSAHETTLEREVAIKILLPGANSDRFITESKITAKLPHPNIPPVYALGTLDNGSPYLAMKLIRGRTLADELKARADVKAELPRFVQILEQISQAVGFAHARGVIHRDLKPANVMVGEFGEVQVMDWGLAKDCRSAGRPESPSAPELNNQEQSPHLTQDGSVLGTPAYMAPEQARGETVDSRADVFALGGILTAILTGKAVFSGTTALDTIIHAAAGDTAESLARLEASQADVELIAVAKQCLSLEPDDRPANGHEVAKLIATYRLGVEERLKRVESERVAAEARAIELRKRRKIQMALVGAVGLLVISGGVFAWWQDLQFEKARTQQAEHKAEQGRLENAKLQADSEREFTMRQARSRIPELLALAKELRGQYRFTEAANTLHQAGQLADTGAPDLRSAIAQAELDLTFVRELDTIRMKRSLWIAEQGGKGRTDESSAPGAYRQAFASRGWDVIKNPEKVGTHVASSEIRQDLVMALDDWAILESEVDIRDRVLMAARKADPNSVVNSFRNPAVWEDEKELKRLLSKVDVTQMSPGAIVTISDLLERNDLSVDALLRHGIAIYPREFLLHYTYGQLLHDKDIDRIGAYRAARAIRPDNGIVLTNLGNALEERKDYEGAMAAFKEAARLDPKDAEAHHGIGRIFKVQKNFDGAIHAIKEAIKLDPTNLIGHYNLGKTLYQKQDYKGAIVAFRDALRIDPSDIDVLIGIGDAYHDSADYQQAIQFLLEATRQDPKNDVAFNRLGRSYLAKKQYKDALTAFRTAAQIDPNSTPSHYNIGVTHFEQADYKSAITSFQRTIQLDKTHLMAHYNIGRSYYALKDYQNAASMYKQVIKINPKHSSTYNNLGYTLRLLGDYEGALSASRKAIELDPKMAYAYNGLALTLSEIGDQNAAIAAYQKAIELDPKYTFAYNNYGQALLKNADYYGAINAYRKAISLDPKDPSYYINLGAVFRILGEHQHSISACLHAVSLKPQSQFTYANLGLALKYDRQYQSAIYAYQRSIELDPSYAYTYNSLAWLLATGPDSVRNGPRAVELAKKACELTKWNDFDYISTLSAAYAEIGDYKSAIEHLQKLSANPKYYEKHREKFILRLDLFEQKKPYREQYIEIAPLPKAIKK